MIRDILLTTAYLDADDPQALRRFTAYRFLAVLAPALPEARLDTIRLADIQQAITSNSDLATVIEAVLAQTRELNPAAAGELDAQLAAVRGQTTNYINQQRIRVQSRHIANKPPLRTSTFMNKVTDDIESTALVTEWLTTNPPVREVQTVLRKASVPAKALTEYVRQRSIADRSKLWITLHDAKYQDQHLAAVGRPGIDHTVITHLHEAIVTADLKTQRTLVTTLLTGNASHDSRARRATSALAIEMLATGRAGAGQNAATLVIRAGGAGTGMTQPLRQAFDDFTSKHPSSMNKGDVRKLWDLNLLTRRKKNPIAALLGW